MSSPGGSDRPPPRTVEELVAYYWTPGGGGYKRALAEARELLAEGVSWREVCEWIGWRPRFLRDALERAERADERLSRKGDAA